MPMILWSVEKMYFRMKLRSRAGTRAKPNHRANHSAHGARREAWEGALLRSPVAAPCCLRNTRSANEWLRTPDDSTVRNRLHVPVGRPVVVHLSSGVPS